MNLRPGAEMMSVGEGTKRSSSSDLITRKCGFRTHFILDMGRLLHGCRLDSTHVNGVVSYKIWV